MIAFQFIWPITHFFLEKEKKIVIHSQVQLSCKDVLIEMDRDLKLKLIRKSINN